MHLLPDLALGGGQSVVLELVRNQDRARFDVLVAYLDQPADLASAFSEGGAEPIWVDRRRRGPVRATAWLARTLRREGVDVLHVHSGPDRKYGQAAALLARVPVVAHLHSPWNHRGYFPPPGAGRARRILSRVKGWARDAVERRTVLRYVAAGDQVRDFHLPFAHAPILTVANGVALEPFCEDPSTAKRVRKELGVDEVAPLLVSVGRLVDGKGHPAMLSMLRHVDATLLLIGDGPHRDDLQALARQEGVDDRVRFLGDRRDVPVLLQAADVFVFASETEGLPMSVLEAMASAKPVVSFALPALAGVVTDGVTGHLVATGDRGAWVRRVNELVGDPAAARAMGEKARADVASRFDGRSMARAVETVYDDVLACLAAGNGKKTS